jgi:CheY-like chemotaxis protein
MAERPVRLLLVEDDRDSADSLSSLLEMWGFAPKVALDGQAALLAAHQDQPDVVLLDLALPVIDGWAVAKQLANAPLPKRPFVIAISGYAGDAAKEPGIDMHLLKPVEPGKLLRILERFEAVCV